MAELVYGDLPAAVQARFADPTAAQKAIDTTLVAARRFCGWHVSPSRSETITLDGPGGRVLSLATLNLTAVASIIELGVAVDVTKLDRSQRKGTLTKPFGYWTSRDGAITATITHGFTEAEALDWRAAIISVVDERSKPSIRNSGDLQSKKIDDVEYKWFTALMSTEMELAMKFAQFQILPAP